MNDLIRETPPPKTHSGGASHGSEYTAWLVAIRDEPGTWFRYPHLMWPSTRTHTATGFYKGTSLGDYECVTRKVDGEKKYAIFARYVGQS